jgi:sortase A
MGIAGHRVTHTHPFLHLDRMRRGDKIYLKTRYGTYTYRVYKVIVVPPNALWILNGRKVQHLVLTACNPPHFATTRIAVFARLVT